MSLHLFHETCVHFSSVGANNRLHSYGVNTDSGCHWWAGYAHFSQTPDITITVICPCMPAIIFSVTSTMCSYGSDILPHNTAGGCYVLWLKGSGSPPINSIPDDRSWKQSQPCLKRPFDMLFNYTYGFVV